MRLKLALKLKLDSLLYPCSKLRLACLSLAMVCSVLAPRAASCEPQSYPAPVEADFVARNYRFESGETLPEVKMHYRTVGTPRKDADGVVRNGVLILHGTGGNGRGFLTDGYAGRLFGKGQLLDAERYFIILPDNVGHGELEQAERRPAHEVSEVSLHRHGEAAASAGDRGARPDAPAARDGDVDGRDAHVDVGLSCSRTSPTAWCRSRAIPWRSPGGTASGARRSSTRSSPIRTWKDGNYTTPPRGMASAIGFLLMATSVPLQWQRQFPTAEAADKYLASQVASRMKSTDANDMIYYFRASEDYNPAPHLEQIVRPAARDQLCRRLRQPAGAADDAGRSSSA